MLGVERIVAAVGGRPKGDLVVFVQRVEAQSLSSIQVRGAVGQAVNLRLFRVVAQNGYFDSAGRRRLLLDFLVAGAGADQETAPVQRRIRCLFAIIQFIDYIYGFYKIGGFFSIMEINSTKRGKFITNPRIFVGLLGRKQGDIKYLPEREVFGEYC